MLYGLLDLGISHNDPSLFMDIKVWVARAVRNRLADQGCGSILGPRGDVTFELGVGEARVLSLILSEVDEAWAKATVSATAERKDTKLVGQLQAVSRRISDFAFGDPSAALSPQREVGLGVFERTGRVVSSSPQDKQMNGTTVPFDKGLRFGNSILSWPDLETVAWRPGAVTFRLKPGTSTKTASGEFVPVDAIDVTDLGDAQEVWSDFISSLGLGIPTEHQE